MSGMHRIVVDIPRADLYDVRLSQDVRVVSFLYAPGLVVQVAAWVPLSVVTAADLARLARSRPRRAIQHFEPGAPVDVLYEGRWLPATVEEQRGDMHVQITGEHYGGSVPIETVRHRPTVAHTETGGDGWIVTRLNIGHVVASCPDMQIEHVDGALSIPAGGVVPGWVLAAVVRLADVPP